MRVISVTQARLSRDERVRRSPVCVDPIFFTFFHYFFFIPYLSRSFLLLRRAVEKKTRASFCVKRTVVIFRATDEPILEFLVEKRIQEEHQEEEIFDPSSG